MRKILVTLILANAVLFASNISTSAMDRNQNFRIVGDFECGQIVEGRKIPEVFAYIQGFATATNVWLTGKKDHFKEMSATEILNWVKAKCSASPLGTLGATLTMMVSELL